MGKRPRTKTHREDRIKKQLQIKAYNDMLRDLGKDLTKEIELKKSFSNH